VSLPTANNPSEKVDVSKLNGLSIVYCYPRTAAPGELIPADWDGIPGARGCTPQACSFRDNTKALYEAGVENIFGVSTQSPKYQRELRDRVHLPYSLLSDADLALSTALQLPLFEWQTNKLMRRVTLAIHNGKVVKYWYPVFPPDKNVYDVLEWVKGWNSHAK
jgi:peroxiredoxin